jgi:hypothetical protein
MRDIPLECHHTVPVFSPLTESNHHTTTAPWLRRFPRSEELLSRPALPRSPVWSGSGRIDERRLSGSLAPLLGRRPTTGTVSGASVPVLSSPTIAADPLRLAGSDTRIVG